MDETPIRAELVGSTLALAMGEMGEVAHGYAPVRLLAQRLIAAGVNPDVPLEVYRGEVLCLWYPSLAAAARTRVRI